MGSYVPLPITKAERDRLHDPRVSIAERYPTRDKYLSLVKDAGNALAKDRYLLADDVAKLMDRATQHWDLLMRGSGTATQ